jgi:hypothetical protein
MDWITDQLAIGDHAEARDAAVLRRQHVRSVLSGEFYLARTIGQMEPYQSRRVV